MTSCAHLEVSKHTVRNLDGSPYGWWQCDKCEVKFIPEPTLPAQPQAVVDGDSESVSPYKAEDFYKLMGLRISEGETVTFVPAEQRRLRELLKPPSAMSDVDGESLLTDAVLDILPDLLAGWWTGETDDGFQHETFEPYDDASRFTGILRAYVQYRKVRQALPPQATTVAVKDQAYSEGEVIATISQPILEGLWEQNQWDK